MAFQEIDRDLFCWTSTCNTYVLRDGEKAILFDLGDGSVLSHLKEIGVRQVDWLLFTHHHREQCQGFAKLKGTGIKLAAPAAEKALFERPTAFRKMSPTLGDAHSVYGASYVRPPLAPIKLDRTFQKMDTFTWGPHEFWCIDTPGNSPGHMSYCLNRGGKWQIVSGDVMLDGAQMHTWFDTEWDYGFAEGIYALGNSAGQLAGYDPALLLPAHGPVIKDGRKQLEEYVQRLRKLAELYVRGYDIRRFAGADQDTVSKPTAVPHVWQLTKHLFKFRGPNYWVNFTLLLADSGKGLLIDCGLFDRSFLDKSLELMKERLGLKQIDAIFVTHMHGDHAQDADHVRDKYGAKLWTLAGVHDKFEQPANFDLAALLPMYDNANKHTGPLKFDRVLENGATFEWEGFTLSCDWMPGQTKYHACLHGVIDERRVAFTGDNIFASTTDPAQGGNEAVVARNGGALEEGYLYAADYLHWLGPDLIIGGHCWVLDQPQQLIERMRERMLSLRKSFTELLPDEDYRYRFDPYFVQVYPYRTWLQPGETAEVQLLVRNYRKRPQKHRVELALPAGLSADKPIFEGEVPAESTHRFPFKLTAAQNAPHGVNLVPLDLTINGQRHGQWFDFLVQVGAAKPESAAVPVKSAGY